MCRQLGHQLKELFQLDGVAFVFVVPFENGFKIHIVYLIVDFFKECADLFPVKLPIGIVVNVRPQRSQHHLSVVH